MPLFSYFSLNLLHTACAVAHGLCCCTRPLRPANLRQAITRSLSTTVEQVEIITDINLRRAFGLQEGDPVEFDIAVSGSA